MKYFLAFLFLITPAHAGKGDIPKNFPACKTVPVQIVTVRGEPDLVFVPVYVNVFQALATKCKMKGRVRWQGACWLPGRIPRS